MKIEITSKHTSDGKKYYEWDLWDGPADCSDHAHGYASDLVVAFSKLIEWRERISADYTDLHTNNGTDSTTDLETLSGVSEEVQGVFKELGEGTTL